MRNWGCRCRVTGISKKALEYQILSGLKEMSNGIMDEMDLILYGAYIDAKQWTNLAIVKGGQIKGRLYIHGQNMIQRLH